MQVIAEGARGEAVLDVQSRLSALGYDIPATERTGTFGIATATAVRAFQTERGLLTDGILGPDTWRQLVEASWRLGDRVLYLRSPNLRGDDVRMLQDLLSTFGFDGGRTDGIFGPDTARATREFQKNYGLPADGIVAEKTVRALDGLPNLSGKMPVMSVRERESLRTRSAAIADLRIVLDPGHGGEDHGAAGIEAAACAVIVGHVAGSLGAAGAQVYVTRLAADGPDTDARAALANTLGAHVFLSLHACSDEPGALASFYGHSRYRSEHGARLAELLIEHIEAIGMPARGTQGRTFGLLRETRMPAVQLDLGALTASDAFARLADPDEQVRVATALVTAITRFALEPTSV